MTSFRKTQTRAYTRRKSTPDNIYWKKLDFPVTVKEFTAIDFIDICPALPHHIAVTSGPKVDIYYGGTTEVVRTMSRFQRLAYGGKFRHDGHLLLAGSEEGQVRLFRQKQLLRIFKGHVGPTHRVDFVRGLAQITTFSDDKTAVVWDLTDENKICTLSGHTDYIRAGLASPCSPHMVLTGGYDHSVRLWDTRTATSVMTVDHGSPVEGLVCFPSGGVVVSAGGTEVRVWDTISGRMLSRLSHHHKTITCVGLASDGKRLLSGSLDRRVKVYDVDTYSVVHTLDYPAPVLSLAVAPGDSTVIVGMISSGSGLLSFQHRRHQETPTQDTKEKVKKAPRKTIPDGIIMLPGDVVAKPDAKEKLASYDNYLRKFRYSKALDDVMLKFRTRKTPDESVAVLHELIRRRGIRSAVAARDSSRLMPLLDFIVKHIHIPAYSQVLMDVSKVLIDVYGDSLDEKPELVKYFRNLKSKLANEIAIGREYVSLVGALQMFLTASRPNIPASDSSLELLTATSSVYNADLQRALHPSVSAQSAEALVVDVS